MGAAWREGRARRGTCMTRRADIETVSATAFPAADGLRAPASLIIAGDLGLGLEGLLLICP